LLENDIQDLQGKGGEIEDIRLSDEEFEMIIDRKRLFGEDADALPTEGKMYDIIDAAVGDTLGAMTT
jgi:hypothetical protein